MLGNLTSLHGLLGFTIETVKDLFETSIFAWVIPFQQYSNQLPYSDLGIALGLGAALVLAAGGYSFFVRKQAVVQEDDQSPRDFLILGALIVFVTTLPITASGRNAHFWGWDRYTYQSVFGVALLMGGLAFHVFKGWLRWAFLFSLLIFGVVTQFGSALYYRDFWKVEREAWWQLSWRAPQIEDGTTLIVALPGGYGLAEEYEVWGPANLVYQPGGPLRLPGQVMFDDIWMDLLARTQEKRLVRGTFAIPRDYGKVIVLSQSSPNTCLHVLDGRRFDQAVVEARPDVRFIAKYSDVGLIDPTSEGVIPLAEVFGSEPPQTWCYFYQKMDLARQTGDWQGAVKLGKEAKKLGVEPSNVTEWMPLLEAYVELGDIENAKRIAQFVREDKYSFNKLCAQYESLKDQPAEYNRNAVYEALCKK
jgi:hypothetical protein